jgi:hypothetical protein
VDLSGYPYPLRRRELRTRATWWRRFLDEYALASVAVDETHLPLHGRAMDAVRRTLYAVGQAFKIAMEGILIAIDKGLIDPYTDVVGVGGSGSGADTALVAGSTRTAEIFAGERSKKLEVREILALSLEKKWW